jgi:POT family proton-dependent oligopeptide transporter
MNSETPPVPAPRRFPPQIKFIVGNEACERFSYYGMISILTLYLRNVMHMEDAHSKEIVHVFGTAVYFLPLLGGWIADRWLGRYWTILSISLFYCLGHAALAFGEGSRSWLYFGLVLIAIGAGGIKPCVSAFVGDQFPATDERLLTKVYGLFYWSINLGAFFAFAIIPWIRDQAGYPWAFGVPGIFMALATVIFWLGTPRYVRLPPARKSGESGGRMLPVFWHALIHSVTRKRVQARQATDSLLDRALPHCTASEVANARAVAGILMIFATVPVFWALFNQVNTSWVLQGAKMAPFQVLGFKVDAERIQSVGSLLILIWVPVLTWGVYPLAERWGWRPTPLRRMAAGMILAAISFFISGWIQSRVDANPGGVTLAWQIAPYIVLEAGEVMVSATSLEFAFSQAPKSLKSTMMSVYLMTIAGGHFLVAVFTALNRKFVGATGANELYFYAILMLVAVGGFAACAIRYRPVTADT